MGKKGLILAGIAAIHILGFLPGNISVLGFLQFGGGQLSNLQFLCNVPEVGEGAERCAQFLCADFVVGILQKGLILAGIAAILLLMAGFVAIRHVQYKENLKSFRAYIAAQDYANAYVLYQDVNFGSDADGYLSEGLSLYQVFALVPQRDQRMVLVSLNPHLPAKVAWGENCFPSPPPYHRRFVQCPCGHRSCREGWRTLCLLEGGPVFSHKEPSPYIREKNKESNSGIVIRIQRSPSFTPPDSTLSHRDNYEDDPAGPSPFMEGKWRVKDPEELALYIRGH